MKSKSTKKQHYWFKHRRYGYGWTPVTWQGWLALAIFLTVVTGGAVLFRDNLESGELSWQLVGFFALVAAATFGAIAISIAKGPKPKWRWGSKPTDNPSEDI